MFNFKCSHAEHWEESNKRWLDVETRLTRLELNEDSFRNKVLRKLQKGKNYEEIEETEEKDVKDAFSKLRLR